MYEGNDFYDVHALLTDEERLARESVRRFVRERFSPLVTESFRAGTFPMEIVPELADLGVFGVNLSGYECGGLSNMIYGLMMQELEYGDSGLRSFASVQNSLVMFPIWKYGSEAQKNHWLPQLAGGTAVGCFGLTEPDFGSDPGNMITRARRDGDDWVLNGSKMWITNGSVADVAVVWARTGDDAKSIRGFLVEKGTKGFTSQDIHGKFSLRASVTSGLSFDDVRLPADAMLPGVAGLSGPLSCLNQARYGIAWGAVGAAKCCYDTARSYAIDRVQFGKPIAAFQLVQQKLVLMLTEITKAELLAYHMGRMKDENKLRHTQVSMTKQNNVMWALEIARMARDVLGANGIADDYPVIRHMVNLESVFTYEGTNDIHKLIIGREITGLSGF